MQKAGTMNVTTPTDLQIRMTRVFGAPRNLVWKTMSSPALIKRWLLGPPGWEMYKCEDELRVGGTFLWAWRGPGGEQFSMHGTYREVVAGTRVVRTEVFDAPAGAPPMAAQVATLELVDCARGTLLTLTVTFPSKEARDAALASGMAQGVTASYDRLADVIDAEAAGLVAVGAR